MSRKFGQLLKTLRLRAGFGLRSFADLVDFKPSNLSALEHGRRSPPRDPDKVRELAEALGLKEASREWAEFFDAARESEELPADIRHLAGRKLVPALLRTIDNRRLTDVEISRLIAQIESQHGG